MKLVPNAVTRKVARQMLQSQKASPNVLFCAGVVGMIGSTVLACRATLKLESIIEETQGNLALANTIEHTDYSDRDRQKDICIIYTRSVVKITKQYGPAILLGAASIGALTKSHNMLNQRNLALTAAYAAVDEAFGKYRGRVVDKYGRDQDEEFRYGTEEVEIVDDKGKIASRVQVGPDAASMYARFFDPYSRSWSKEPEYNLAFLRNQQNWANDQLRVRGHLLLNEVYDMLGLDRTSAGSVVGWIISNDGDNFVDFGFSDSSKEGVRNFVNGREGSILLDFNVDGVIWDKIDNYGKGEPQWQR